MQVAKTSGLNCVLLRWVQWVQLTPIISISLQSLRPKRHLSDWEVQDPLEQEWQQQAGQDRILTGQSVSYVWDNFKVHCTALHWTSLHCTALHCTALHCTALHCTELHCTALHCTCRWEL
jgi:hypothetical protein